MKVGTKSVLFGYHQFLLHPLIVAWAWWKLYGFPNDWRLWAAFFVHDLGLWGKPNMDGPEGEQHPEWGAQVMVRYITRDRHATPASWPYNYWYWFTKYHSRHLAKRDGVHYSPLCVADKLAITLYPKWLYVLLVALTGEQKEYMIHPVTRGAPLPTSTGQWVDQVQASMRQWVEKYRYGGEDEDTDDHDHSHYAEATQ